MASKHQNDGNDLAYKYQDEEFNALKKEGKFKLERNYESRLLKIINQYFLRA